MFVAPKWCRINPAVPGDIDRVRDRLDIVEVISKRLALRKAGKNFQGVCPFHDDRKPSLNVNPALGIYKCFACGAGGDAFKFVMEFHKVDFGEALRMLAEEVGVELTGSGQPSGGQGLRKRRLEAMQLAQKFFVRELERSKEAKDYLQSRGIDEKVVAEWGLGFAPLVGDALAMTLKKEGVTLSEAQELFLVDQDAGGGYYDRFRGRLMFPIHDEHGVLVAFGGRLLGQGNPKYINSGDTPIYSKRRLLYGLHKARDSQVKTSRAVLVEGYLDVIACHRAGVTQAVASLGTSLSEDHAKLFNRYGIKEVTVLYDADAAGEKAAERAEEVLGTEGIRVRMALMPSGDDPDSLLRREGPAAVERAATQSVTPLAFRLARLERQLDPDNQDFWDQAVALLAQAPTDLEIQEHLPRLSEKYPGSTDLRAVSDALMREVRRLRRVRQNPRAAIRPRMSDLQKTSELHPAESLILLGVLTPELCAASLQLLREPGLLVSRAAMAAVEEILNVPADELAGGSPSRWLHELSEETQKVLMDVSDRSLITPTAVTLEDAAKKLRLRRKSREIQKLSREESKDDDALAAIAHKLKELKNPEESQSG